LLYAVFGLLQLIAIIGLMLKASSVTLDAIGPETFTFEGFLRLLASKLKPDVKLVHLPPALGIALGRIVGLAVGDVLLTKAELQGLMDGMLTSSQAPNGRTRFTDWLEQHRDSVGTTYASELGRHFHWRKAQEGQRSTRAFS